MSMRQKDQRFVVLRIVIEKHSSRFFGCSDRDGYISLAFQLVEIEETHDYLNVRQAGSIGRVRQQTTLYLQILNTN